MTVIDSRFDGDRPISCAEGRYGDIIIAQSGVQPARWPGSGDCTDAGIEAPEQKPGLALNSIKNYYIARTDITKPGAVYYAPPTVTYELSEGMSPGQPAAAKAYLEQAAVSEIVQDKGGKYYPEEPTVVLGDSHGKGAELVAILDAPSSYVADENNSPETGITGFEMISDGPPWGTDSNLPSDGSPTTYGLWPWQDIPLDSNGIITVTGDRRYWSTDQCGTTSSYFVQMRTEVEVTGHVSGSGAVVRVNGGGFAFLGSSCDCSVNFCWFDFTPCITIESTVANKMGKGYAPDADIAIIIPATSYYDADLNRQVQYKFGEPDGGKNGVNAEHWNRAAIIRCYAGNDPRNPGDGKGGHPVKLIEIRDGGSGYLVAPQLKITSSTGFGAYATCEVKGGEIVEVTLENGGGGYLTPPEVKVLAGGAEAFAISRPHLRGLYQCYVRYTDDTPEDRGGPVPSNLSEVNELDAGEAATSVTWSWVGTTNPRVTHTELWRSTSGQATTLYRVARVAGAVANTFVDDLTDEELRDPDREGYAALPILLPNGELNAMRFVPPPDDKDVVVKFQDRMWYGVDGELPNAIYYSETGEPESVPEENEVIIQQNDRDSDRLRAMIPFGQTLFLAQERHLFSLTFSQIPLLDGQVSPVAFRGCINQRCWQIHEGYCYAADHYGVYRFNLGGQVEDLSEQIFDEFEDGIDFGNVTWNFMSIDFSSKTMRLFVAHVDDGVSTVPTRALCYDIGSQTWWWEKYPQPITASTQATLVDGTFRTVYGCKSGLAILDYGATDLARGLILTATVTDAGAGYRRPPKVLAPGGNGARLQACLNSDNAVEAIWIMEPGFGYTDGDLVLSAPDDPNVPPESRRQATAVFTASDLDTDLPTWPTFHVKTGNIEYPSDATDKNGGTEQRRDISLAYKPTDRRNELSVRMYYNNADHPRPNVTERDRGTGFVDSTVDPASRIDLGYMIDEYGADNGVARAIRTGKTLEDIRSADRHVSVEVCGPRRTQDPLVIYTLDVFGGGGGAG